MTLEVSVGELLKTLERKIALHREQAALHAREEELHHRERTLHEAELESATRHFEALKAAAGPAAEVAMSAYAPAPARLPEPEEDGLELAANPPLTALIARILKAKAQGEPFGPTALTAEINQRFRDHLDGTPTSAASRPLCDGCAASARSSSSAKDARITKRSTDSRSKVDVLLGSGRHPSWDDAHCGVSLPGSDSSNAV